jgi:alkyl hydroperoxide reductase subunit AhpC
MGIKYSLLADFHPKGSMSEKYGVYLGEKGITGRAIFIVDKAGKVAWAKHSIFLWCRILMKWRRLWGT